MRRYLWFLWNFHSLAVDINIKFVPQRFEIRDYEKRATQTQPVAHPQSTPPLCASRADIAAPLLRDLHLNWDNTVTFRREFSYNEMQNTEFHWAKPALEFPCCRRSRCLIQLPAAWLVSFFLFPSEAAVPITSQSFLPPRNPSPLSLSVLIML